MGRNKFHSVVDWDEIEDLRSQFRCESRVDSGDGSLAIEVEGTPFVPVYASVQALKMACATWGSRPP